MFEGTRLPILLLFRAATIVVVAAAAAAAVGVVGSILSVAQKKNNPVPRPTASPTLWELLNPPAHVNLCSAERRSTNGPEKGHVVRLLLLPRTTAYAVGGDRSGTQSNNGTRWMKLPIPRVGPVGDFHRGVAGRRLSSRGAKDERLAEGYDLGVWGS